TDDRAAAAAELVQRGQVAIPALLEALERRDLDLRCRALEVMQRLMGDVHFDPYAPEALRHQQIALLRERMQRRAGGGGGLCGAGGGGRGAPARRGGWGPP